MIVDCGYPLGKYHYFFDLKSMQFILHREDGAAIEYVDGEKEYYLLGVKYSPEEFERAVKLKLFW